MMIPRMILWHRLSANLVRALTVAFVGLALGACQTSRPAANAAPAPATKPVEAKPAVAAPSSGPVVDTSINAPFKDPDVDRFIKTFEGEDRAIYHHRNEIVAALNLKPGMSVGDIGAGTGFFSRMMAPEVLPGGKVYAVDIAQKFIDHIQKTSKEQSIANIQTVLCDQHSTMLPPGSIDLAFVCDVYHHFEYPKDALGSINAALRPGGRLVVIDFERIVGVSQAFALVHVRGGKGLTSDEIKNAGFDFVREVPMMEGQYFIEFQKRAAKAKAE